MNIGPINTNRAARSFRRTANRAARNLGNGANRAANNARRTGQQIATDAQRGARQAGRAAGQAAAFGAQGAAQAAGKAAAGAGAAAQAGAAAGAAATEAGVGVLGSMWGATKSMAGAAIGVATGAARAAVGVATRVVGVVNSVVGVVSSAVGAAMSKVKEVAVAVAGAAMSVASFIGDRTVRFAKDLFVDQGNELSGMESRVAAANQGDPAVKKHGSDAEVKEYWELNLATYNDGEGIPEGWEEVPNAEERLGVPLTDPETGLKARVYKNEDGTHVLVFEGSSSDDLPDWEANFSNAAGTVPKQHRQALDIALRFKEEYGDEGDLVISGHSLGGGLATFAGLGAGVEVYTFNPSGLGPGSRAWLEQQGVVDRNEHLITNYVQNGEILDDLRIAQSVAMPLFMGLTGGSLQLVGEVIRVGEVDSDPISLHNEPQL